MLGRRIGGWFGLAALFAGCGGSGHAPPDAAPDAPPCVVDGGAVVELGTGPEDGMGFVPMIDGQTVPLTFGVQQGFHVWTNIRARNVCFSQLDIRRTARIVESGELIIMSEDQLGLVPASDPGLAAAGWGELPFSRPTFMCPNASGLTIPGRTIELFVDITDSQGRTASDHHTVVPECPNNMYLARCFVQCGQPLDAGADGSTVDGGGDGGLE